MLPAEPVEPIGQHLDEARVRVDYGDPQRGYGRGVVARHGLEFRSVLGSIGRTRRVVHRISTTRRPQTRPLWRFDAPEA